MSAFLVSPKHLNAIITFAVRNRISIKNQSGWIPLTQDNAEEVGQILFDENARSVAYRYNEDEDKIKFLFNPCGGFSPVQILKLLNCYDYQACETADYEQTQAAHIINQIRNAAIRSLDGYDDASWAI